MEQATISQQFADMYYLELKEGRRVRTSEFLATVNSVLSRIRQDDGYFKRIVKDSAIKFVYNDECVPTMSVDDRGNVYVSVNYIVLSLNMDEELIYALFLNAYYTIKDQYLDEEKKFYRCPICFKVPKIQLKENSIVQIECDCFNENHELTAEESKQFIWKELAKFKKYNLC